MRQPDKIRLGISACLLGEHVRYDAGHKLDPFLRDTLGRFVEYVPVCPEVEAGLGVPREAMHLAGDPGDPRLVTINTGRDFTALMKTWAAGRVQELAEEGLCGFIFKSRSPSSGMERIKVYTGEGQPVATGVGLFARAFMERFPLLPVEDEGRLHDPGLRENFIERIFAYMRWRKLASGRLTAGALVEFHAEHKLQIMSHSPKHYTEMGRLVAGAKGLPREELAMRYERLMMEALRLKATISKNTNVLMHIMGYFKKLITPDEKAELLEVIGRYQDGLIPLIVPITLVNHYVRKYDEQYLGRQHYLHPHPVELKLRNHA